MGEVRRGEGECVGEDLDVEHVTDGGERVCCVTEDGWRCCIPLGSGVTLDGELWTELVRMESDLLEEGVEDAEGGTVFGRGGDCTTSS